jgi:hypothetical protein
MEQLYFKQLDINFSLHLGLSVLRFGYFSTPKQPTEG